MSRQDWIVMALCVQCLIIGFMLGFRVEMKYLNSERSALKSELARVNSENCFLQLRIERYKEAGFLDELESMPETSEKYLKEVK